MESMKEHQPYEHSMISIPTEHIGLAVYINLAQSIQVIGAMVAGEETLTTEEMLQVIDTMASTLCWMDATGFSSRHPALQDMPHKVAPLDFQGDRDGITRWVREEINKVRDGEEFKSRSYLN